MSEPGVYPIASLIDRSCLAKFDCTPIGCTDSTNISEYADINHFLIDSAYDYDVGNLAKTYVYLQNDNVIGFFTTLASLTTIKSAYRRAKHITTNGASNYPSIDIVYFAIDRNYQQQKEGSALMKALLTMIYEEVVPYTGVALVTVQALEVAVSFYAEKFSFERHASKNSRGKQDMALTIPEIEELVGT